MYALVLPLVDCRAFAILTKISFDSHLVNCSQAAAAIVYRVGSFYICHQARIATHRYYYYYHFTLNEVVSIHLRNLPRIV